MNRKLTEEQAQSIIDRVAAGEPQKKLAAEFGMSPASVSKLVRGLSWPDLDRPEGGVVRQRRTKLTESDVHVILTRLMNREKPASIAADFKVTRQTIADIQKGKTWSHVPRPKPPEPVVPSRRRRVWEQ